MLLYVLRRVFLVCTLALGMSPSYPSSCYLKTRNIQSNPSTPSQDPVTVVVWKRDILDFHFLLIAWFLGGREKEMVVAHRVDNSHHV